MTEGQKTTESSPQRKPVKQNISDGYFYLALCFVAALVVPFLYYSYTIYHYNHEHKPHGYKYPEFKQLWMTGVGAFSFGFLKEIIEFVFNPIYTRLIAHKGDDYLWQRKVNKALANTTGLFYFSMSTYWGWCIMKDSVWLPDFLGGQNPKGSIEASLDTQFIETPGGIHCYILFTYGYHVQDFLRHLFFEDVDNDWREMLLHHIAALALYPGFVFSNLMGVGVILAWLHDIADITVNLTRIFNALDLSVPTVVFYLIMVSTWGYTRLYVLPLYIYKALTEMRFPEQLSHFQPMVWLEISFLMIMQVLHVLWFFMFLKMGYRLVTKGERKDIINDVEGAKDTKKVQ